MKKRFVTVQSTMTFEIPMVPNYIRVYGQESSIDIRTIDPKILQQIGEEWIKKLIEHSKRKGGQYDQRLNVFTQ